MITLTKHRRTIRLHPRGGKALTHKRLAAVLARALDLVPESNIVELHVDRERAELVALVHSDPAEADRIVVNIEAELLSVAQSIGR